MRLKIVILMLLTVIFCSSANANIDAILNTYDDESGFGKIQLANRGEVDYHNVRLTINDRDYGKVVDLLRPTHSIAVMKILHPGANGITITTDEGAFTDEITPFVTTPPLRASSVPGPKTPTQVENDRNLQELQDALAYKGKVLEQRAQSNFRLQTRSYDQPLHEGANDEVNYWWIVGIIIIAICVLAMIEWIILMRKKQ